MVISEHTIKKIRATIKRHYKLLTLRLIGDLKTDKLFQFAYNHSFIAGKNPPKTLHNALQSTLTSTAIPQGDLPTFERENTDENIRTLIAQQAINTQARIENAIRTTNKEYKSNALLNLKASPKKDLLARKKVLPALVKTLASTSEKATTDFSRIIVTELSEITSNAKVDRIIDNHMKAKFEADDETPVDTSEIYVYRVVVQDSVTDKTCRKFYGNVGETPKVYRLSTLLGNGSNYGKKQVSWLAVAGLSHVNSRTSPVIELPAGYIVVGIGRMEFVGQEKAKEWLKEHLVA